MLKGVNYRTSQEVREVKVKKVHCCEMNILTLQKHSFITTSRPPHPYSTLNISPAWLHVHGIICTYLSCVTLMSMTLTCERSTLITTSCSFLCSRYFFCRAKPTDHCVTPPSSPPPSAGVLPSNGLLGMCRWMG